jgi:hypothetical protein
MRPASSTSGKRHEFATGPLGEGGDYGRDSEGSGIPPHASVPNPNLEAALERLRKAAGLAGAGVERAHPDEIRKR